MEHGEFNVDILSQSGEVIGQKPRREVDKRKDLYHTIHILLFTPDNKPVVSIIPSRKDLPNLYENRRGTTAATIQRSGETAIAAALRCLDKELDISDINPDQLQKIANFKDEKGFFSAFTLTHEVSANFSRQDITDLVIVEPEQLTEQIKTQPEQFAPRLQMLWEIM